MATSSVAVLWIGVLSLVLTVLRYGVSGAPVSDNQVQFYNRLYQNSSQPRCYLPKVDEKSENYTRSKINHLCDDSKGVAKYGSLCIALTDLFPRLCQNQSTSRKINATVAVDLSSVNSLGVRKVCSNLQELRANISSLGHQKLASPFVTETPGSSAENEDSLCMTLCKNSRDFREGFQEDNKLEVSLPCVLLLEGYTVLQNISVNADKQGISISNVVAPSSASLSGNQIGTSSTKDTKLTESNGGSVTAKSKSEPTDAGIAAKKNVISINTSPSPNANEKSIPEAAAAAATTSTSKSKSLNDVSLEQPGADPVQSNASTNKIEDEEKALTDKQQAIKNAVMSGIPAITAVGTIKRLNQTNPAKESKISSSSSTTTTTTETVIDARGNDVPMPLEKEMKSSTATSKVITDAPKKNIDVVAPVPLNTDGSEKNEAVKNKKQSAKPLFSKKNDDSDVLAGLGEDDGADYNPGEDLDNGYGKPPSKFDDDKEIEMPQPETQNLGYESFKPAKSSFSGNAFREDIAFDRGTTINVSLKESEDTGFFNYFLFSVTLVGLIYLVVHNKKKVSMRIS